VLPEAWFASGMDFADSTYSTVRNPLYSLRLIVKADSRLEGFCPQIVFGPRAERRRLGEIPSAPLPAFPVIMGVADRPAKERAEYDVNLTVGDSPRSAG